MYLSVNIGQLCGLGQINFSEHLKQRLYPYISGSFAEADEITYAKPWTRLEEVPRRTSVMLTGHLPKA